MIDLVVTAYNGAATPPLSGHFDELGGNIGRAENNQLVLPDPERTISRVHAQVVFRNGRYAIVDRGSNPISVNGRPLGNGQEAPIQPGDEVQIGGYSIRVQAGSGAAPAAAADPFADFAGLAAAPAAGRPAAPPAYVDPLAGFGAPPAAPRGGMGAPAAPAPSAMGGIPADWDPFAPDAPAPAAGPLGMGGFGAPASGAGFGLDTSGRAEPLIPDFAPGAQGGGDSLDALFGLGGTGSGADPLAGSALNQAVAQPNMAAHHDPLKSLNSVTRGVAASAADTTSELSAPFQIAPMTPQAARPAAPAAPFGAAPSAAPFGAPAARPATPPGARPPPLAGRPTLPPPGAPDDPFAGAFGVPGSGPSAGAGGGAAGFIPTAFGIPPPAATLPPPAVPPRPMPPAAAPAGLPPQRAGGMPAGASVAPPGSVLSWDDPSGESRTVIRPRGGVGAARPATPPPPASDLDLSLDFDAPPSGAASLDPLAGFQAMAASAPSAPTAASAPAMRANPPATSANPQPMPAMAPPTTAMPASPAATQAPPRTPAPGQAAGTPAWRPPPGVAAPAAVGEGADVQALTAAFREGLQVPSLPPDLVLTPALMKLVGRLVHEATRGTVELLVARAALKREIRAEVTMIVAKENNPLKFSPSAEVALGHLLAPPARGFMEGDRAMRDAYDDLRAHQFGFLAGMRAALEGILKRFDPAVLETKLTQKSMLSSLLPAKRKAQMWDVFIQLYGQISSEASDDFHELFGKEFLRAYNEYIDQLEQDRP